LQGELVVREAYWSFRALAAGPFCWRNWTLRLDQGAAAEVRRAEATTTVTKLKGYMFKDMV
jgi:hypothetical protein